MQKIKIRIISLALLFLPIFIVSCKKEKLKESNEITEQQVYLDVADATIEVGQPLVLKATFGDVVAPERNYKWVSSDVAVVSVKALENWQAIVEAKAEGTAIISITSDDGLLRASCTITVKRASDGIIRILAIGNSFSGNALEDHLYGVAKAGNKSVIIGNLYIGGASLDMHWKNASNNNAAYEYRKIAVDGTKTTTKSVSIATALADEHWDYISFQQASPNSGQYNTYITPLPLLYNYVKQRLNRNDITYILHQTWAYAQNSTHTGFANYNKDQLTMYYAIVEAVEKASKLIGTDIIIPAGTAVQNARTSIIGDNLCVDGYHLLDLGKYIASATWYEAVFNQNVIGNSYKPEAISAYEIEIAQHAAHSAIVKSNEVTRMTAYQSWNGNGQTQEDIFVNFGQTSSVIAGWNNFSAYSGNYNISNLRDKNSNPSGISIELLERFNAATNNGAKVTNTEMNLPELVSSTGFFGNTGISFNSLKVEKSVLKLKGLNKDMKYNFCFFGSRMEVSDNRETSYTIKGTNQKTTTLNTTKNTSNIACADGLLSDENGELVLTITSGPNNDNVNGFYYLNALRISVNQ